MENSIEVLKLKIENIDLKRNLLAEQFKNLRIQDAILKASKEELESKLKEIENIKEVVEN